MHRRYITLLLPMIFAALFVQCFGGKKTKYNLPKTLSKEQRESMLGQCKKGRELYKINCSECHGIFTSGKDKIPNFSDQQIDNYSARFMRHDPNNHAVAQKMSPEQLRDVLSFLRYRQVKK